MAFRVGQKVVCVFDFSKVTRATSLPVKDRVYTIRGVRQTTAPVKCPTGLLLEEVVNQPIMTSDMGVVELAWATDAFRPAVERKTDTGFAILTEILNGQRVPEVTS